MTAPVCVRVADFAGGPFAVSAEDGQRLCQRIMPLLHVGTPVALSFAGIEAVIGAFLNAALGPLCTDFPEDRLGDLLTLWNISVDDLAVVERSLHNTRVYYANRAACEAAWAAELGEDEAVQEVTQP
jgi:hypothetical protein